VCDTIVTNPPYNSAEGFVSSGLHSARRKLCLLLRLAFLEGANRHRTIFGLTPPSRVRVFSERITFYLQGARSAHLFDARGRGQHQVTKFAPVGRDHRIAVVIDNKDRSPALPRRARRDEDSRRPSLF
jgi:hypothetical protein